jgi:hypothetical protein
LMHSIFRGLPPSEGREPLSSTIPLSMSECTMTDAV